MVFRECTTFLSLLRPQSGPQNLPKGPPKHPRALETSKTASYKPSILIEKASFLTNPQFSRKTSFLTNLQLWRNKLLSLQFLRKNLKGL